MSANIQDDEFSGIAAASICEHMNLQRFLVSKKVDTARYEAVGAGFHSESEGSFSGYITCKDNQKSTEEREHLIRVHFEQDITKEEFFSLFKRFEVLITPRHGGYRATEVNGELVISKNEEQV